MRKAGRLFRMKQRSIGKTSPPRSTNEGKYVHLSKFGSFKIKRLNGINVFLTSLGSIGLGTRPSSWTNPSNAPNRQGTLQENIDFWKGQKVHIPFRNSLKKILSNLAFLQAILQKMNWRSFKNMEFNYESSTSDPHRKKYEPARVS